MKEVGEMVTRTAESRLQAHEVKVVKEIQALQARAEALEIRATARPRTWLDTPDERACSVPAGKRARVADQDRELIQDCNEQLRTDIKNDVSWPCQDTVARWRRNRQRCAGAPVRHPEWPATSAMVVGKLRAARVSPLCCRGNVGRWPIHPGISLSMILLMVA